MSHRNNCTIDSPVGVRNVSSRDNHKVLNGSEEPFVSSV